jgi:hypothetical protein
MKWIGFVLVTIAALAGVTTYKSLASAQWTDGELRQPTGSKSPPDISMAIDRRQAAAGAGHSRSVVR